MYSSRIFPPYPAKPTRAMPGKNPNPEVATAAPVAARIGRPDSPAKSFMSLKERPSSSMAISLPSSRPSLLRPFLVRINRPRASCLKPSFPTLSVR